MLVHCVAIIATCVTSEQQVEKMMPRKRTRARTIAASMISRRKQHDLSLDAPWGILMDATVSMVSYGMAASDIMALSSTCCAARNRITHGDADAARRAVLYSPSFAKLAQQAPRAVALLTQLRGRYCLRGIWSRLSYTIDYEVALIRLIATMRFLTGGRVIIAGGWSLHRVLRTDELGQAWKSTTRYDTCPIDRLHWRPHDL